MISVFDGLDDCREALFDLSREEPKESLFVELPFDLFLTVERSEERDEPVERLEDPDLSVERIVERDDLVERDLSVRDLLSPEAPVDRFALDLPEDVFGGAVRDGFEERLDGGF